jgi:TetR/AcrR family transcriptional regulator, transcriptional repressor for nem operon
MEPTTKERLLEVGLALLLEHGYHGLGVQTLLEAAKVPKGSFYHHFKSKEDFALQVVDRYMVEVHEGLDACLGDAAVPPLDRIRTFFRETREKYRREGYMGCLLGSLGQELSAASEVFGRKIDRCLAVIARQMASCLREAQARGEIAPDADPDGLADRLLDCWEGAALRSRLLRSPEPLEAMLDFYFRVACARPTG